MARKDEPNAGRDKLIRAAAEIFARVGFAGASVGDIARAAGVTQPLVNHHFGTKKGLWQAVVHEHFAELEQTLEDCEARTEGMCERERLRALLYAFVLFSGRRPQLTRMMRMEADGSLAGEVSDEWNHRFVSFLETRLARAVKAGVLAPLDPRYLYFFIIGASTELFAQPELAQRVFKLDVSSASVIEDGAQFVCDFILKGAAATTA